MRVINQTNNNVLAEEAFVADTIFTRMKGLLGREKLSPGQALIIRPCNCVHTFFMRFPIDVLFVDKNNRVAKTLPCLKPFRITAAYFNAAFVVELPVGTIESSSVQEGDTLGIE